MTDPRSRLALIVGADTEGRRRLARNLTERRWAFVTCPGPPGCPLLIEEPCGLVEVADATVFMPLHSSRREVRTELALCARAAAAPVIVEPSAVEPRPDSAVVVLSADPDDVIDAIESAVARRSRRVHGRRATADVADLWL